MPAVFVVVLLSLLLQARTTTAADADSATGSTLPTDTSATDSSLLPESSAREGLIGRAMESATPAVTPGCRYDNQRKPKI